MRSSRLRLWPGDRLDVRRSSRLRRINRCRSTDASTVFVNWVSFRINYIIHDNSAWKFELEKRRIDWLINLEIGQSRRFSGGQFVFEINLVLQCNRKYLGFTTAPLLESNNFRVDL